MGGGAEDGAMLADEFQKEGDSDGGDEGVDARFVAQGAVGEAFDGEAEQGAGEDGKNQSECGGEPGGGGELPGCPGGEIEGGDEDYIDGGEREDRLDCLLTRSAEQDHHDDRDDQHE